MKMDYQGNIVNNTSDRMQQSIDRDNTIESKDDIHARTARILAMLPPLEIPKVFKPLVHGDSKIDDFQKDLEENSVRMQQSNDRDNAVESEDDMHARAARILAMLTPPEIPEVFKPFVHGNPEIDGAVQKDLEENSVRTQQSQEDNEKSLKDRFLSPFFDMEKINLGGNSESSTSNKEKYDIQELIKRQQKLFKEIQVIADDENSKKPNYVNPYKNYNELNHDFKMPDFNPTKIDFVNYTPRERSFSYSYLWIIAPVAIAIMCIVLMVKMITQPHGNRLEERRQREQQLPAAAVSPSAPPAIGPQRYVHGSLAHLVSSDFSANRPDSDLPPTYTECATKNHDNVHIYVNHPELLIVDEPPPPYSVCLGLLTNDDDCTEKPQNNEMEYSFVTDTVDNNVMETSCTINVGERNNHMETSTFNDTGTVDTTMTISGDNVQQ